MKNKYFFPAYIFGTLILIGSSLNPEKFEKVQKYSDFFEKVLSDYSLHFFAFGILTVLLFYGFYKIKKSPLPFLRIGLYSIVYGMFIEIYQILYPYREFNLEDIMSDAVGIIFFLVLLKVFIVRKKKSEKEGTGNFS